MLIDYQDTTPRTDALCRKCGQVLRSKNILMFGESEKQLLFYFCQNDKCKHLGLATVTFNLKQV